MKFISKRELWHKVNAKLRGRIHNTHVYSVINLLFEELISDLLNEKDIDIINFGTFTFKKMKDRRFWNVSTKEISTAPGNYVLRFFIANKLRKRILKNIAVDKKLKDTKNE